MRSISILANVTLDSGRSISRQFDERKKFEDWWETITAEETADAPKQKARAKKEKASSLGVVPKFGGQSDAGD